MASKRKLKKGKNQISKLIEKPDSEDDTEQELSFYVNDRVKLMKQILKIIKPKKIKSMAPDCIKDLDIEEINSMLLEELLGISNKRLKYIFNGQNLDEDSSSTEEEENQPIDIISLDDVSEDDFIIDLVSDKPKKHKHGKVKQEPKEKKVKREKAEKKRNKEAKGPTEENLMSVLELLELQARARAIRSQLLLEANKKNEQATTETVKADSDDDAVIIESPKNDEIVITSSDSEEEPSKEGTSSKQLDKTVATKLNKSDATSKKGKIKLVRDRFGPSQKDQSIDLDLDGENCIELIGDGSNNVEEAETVEKVVMDTEIVESTSSGETTTKELEKEDATPVLKSSIITNCDSQDNIETLNSCNEKSTCDDTIVINVEEEEIDRIIGD